MYLIKHEIMRRVMMIVLTMIVSGLVWTTADSTPAAAAIVAGEVLAGVSYSEELLQNISFTDIDGHWARQAVVRMAAQAVIDGKGDRRFHPEDLLSKEEALVLLVRVLGQEDKAQQATGGRPIARNVPPSWSDGYLVQAVAAGIVKQAELLTIIAGRTQPAERQVIGVWVARALGLAPVYGARQQTVYNFSDWQQISTAYLPSVEVMLREKLMVGNTPNTFAPLNPIKRGEMAVLLDRINPRLMTQRKLDSVRGEIVERTEGRQTEAGMTVDQVRIGVQTDDGRLIYLLTTNAPGGDKDFVVYRADRLGRSPLLEKGDAVQVTRMPDGVVLVEATAETKSAMSGTLLSMDSAKMLVTIADSNGQTVSHPLNSRITVTIEGREARLGDLLQGQGIALNLRNGQVTSIRADLGDALPGYQQPSISVVNGRIREIGAGEIHVLDSTGKEQLLRVSGATGIFRGGIVQSVGNLRVGDIVKLSVTGDGDATRVEVGGVWGAVTAIVRGRVEKVNTGGRQLVLGLARTHYFGEWLFPQGVKVVEIDPDAPIYVGERRLEWSQVPAELLGQQVYVAVTTPYGQELGIKVVAGSGDPDTSNGPLHALSAGRQELRLEGETVPVQFGSGTIVVRNSRLVEPADLNPGNHLFVTTAWNALSQQAMVIASQGLVPTGRQFYRGVIDTVHAGDFRLTDYSMLEENGWSDAGTVGNHITITPDRQTVIIDASGDENKTISATNFFLSRYYDSDEDYEDDYVYLATREGRVETMVIYPASEVDAIYKSSLGQVKLVDTSTDRLVLEGVMDYSETYQEWVQNPELLNLRLSAAIIIRDDLAAEPEDLRNGDTVYVVHDQDQALLLVTQ